MFKKLSTIIPYKKKKDWLFRDFKNLLFVFALMFFCGSLMATILRLIDVGKVYLFSKTMDDDFWYGCVFAPMAEDFLFRWVPITGIALLLTKEQFSKCKWFVAILSSMVFGAYLHEGYWSIYIQGVCGLCICYLYFKNRYGYVSGVLAHFLWNFSTGFILPYLGDFKNHPIFY